MWRDLFKHSDRANKIPDKALLTGKKVKLRLLTGWVKRIMISHIFTTQEIPSIPRTPIIHASIRIITIHTFSFRNSGTVTAGNGPHLYTGSECGDSPQKPAPITRPTMPLGQGHRVLPFRPLRNGPRAIAKKGKTDTKDKAADYISSRRTLQPHATERVRSVSAGGTRSSRQSLQKALISGR